MGYVGHNNQNHHEFFGGTTTKATISTEQAPCEQLNPYIKNYSMEITRRTGSLSGQFLKEKRFPGEACENVSAV